MSDSTRTSEPDLSNLTGDFDIVGELGGRPRTQYLIATRKTPTGKRRDDMDRVLVEVVHPPEGDESHALDHLASDTKLLSSLRHRRLVSIVEGRWLGPDAFAVIREYVDDPSVADLLARGDTFTNTRIAAMRVFVNELPRARRSATLGSSTYSRMTANASGPSQRPSTIDTRRRWRRPLSSLVSEAR